MTSELTLRLKYLCGRYWRLLVPALVVLSALAFGGAAAGVTSDAQPQQTTVETDSMTVETALSTEATVTGNTTLYEQNETLTNVPVYLRSATPKMRLIAVTTTPSDRTVSVTQRIVLRLSATRNGDVFWRDSGVQDQDRRSKTVVPFKTQPSGQFFRFLALVRIIAGTRAFDRGRDAVEGTPCP